MKFMTYLSRLIILFLPLIVSGQTSNNPPPVSRINPIDLQSGGIWNWHQRWDFGTENLVKNGRFEYWSFGTDTIPDGWSHSYAEVNCDVTRDTFRHSGNYSMRVTANGNDGYTDYRFTIDDAWRNRYLTLGFWYYCPETNDKTQKVLFSNNNPGGSSIATLKQDNAWHWAKLTIWCDTELSYVLVRVSPSYGTTDTDDYLIIDEMNMHRGTLAPVWTRSAWDVLSDYAFFLRARNGTIGISIQNYLGTLYLKNADQTAWAGMNAKAFTSTRAAGANNNAITMQHVGAPAADKIAWKWSVRNNDEDLWLYGYNGTITKNLIRLDWTDQSATFGGSVTSNGNGVIEGDATSGRVYRVIELYIKNGTNANTLKCEVASSWNGDTIAETDNISKGGTTGDFYLNGAGSALIVEANGLTGNVVMALGTIYYNSTGTGYDANAYPQANDIQLNINSFSGVNQDMTSLVDSGEIYIRIIYLTDA